MDDEDGNGLKLKNKSHFFTFSSCVLKTDLKNFQKVIIEFALPAKLRLVTFFDILHEHFWYEQRY